ncbi:MAG: rhodanese-like domain-containing protein [Candidatus Aminicenantia bacterium]
MKVFVQISRQSLIIILISSLIGLLINLSLIKKYLNQEVSSDFILLDKNLSISEITIFEAEDLFREEKALFLDARTEEKYKKGHILGAINLPLSKIKSPDDFKKIKLPEDKILITYCEGGDCRSSLYLAYYLIKAGYKNVKMLTGGWPGWLEAGLPWE